MKSRAQEVQNADFKIADTRNVGYTFLNRLNRTPTYMVQGPIITILKRHLF